VTQSRLIEPVEVPLHVGYRFRRVATSQDPLLLLLRGWLFDIYEFISFKRSTTTVTDYNLLFIVYGMLPCLRAPDVR